MWLFLSTNVLQWLFFEYIEKFCDWAKQEKFRYAYNTLHNENAGKLPLHILLNSQCNLLHRKKAKPIHLLVKAKQLLENIAATSNVFASTPTRSHVIPVNFLERKKFYTTARNTTHKWVLLV